MADGASSVEDSPDDDSDFIRSCTTTGRGHRKRRDDDSDLGRTRTATGQTLAFSSLSSLSFSSALCHQQMIQILQCMSLWFSWTWPHAWDEQGELRHSEGSASWTGGLTMCWHIIWKVEHFEPFLVKAVERVNVL